MKNQQGYVFFSTLIVASIVLLFIVKSIDLFVTEKQFAGKAESMYIIDHLLFLAKVDSTTILQEEESANTGTFLYEHGNVSYNILAVDEELVRVSFVATGYRGGKGEGYLLYNLVENKMVKWSEI